MSKNKHARKVRIPVMPTQPLDAQSVETPAAAEVKPSLFSRVVSRVKTFFSRSTPKAPVAMGRSMWSKLWAAVNRVVQAAVVQPAKKVGGFFARLGRKVGAFCAQLGRKVAAFGRRVAATRAFKIAHAFVRTTLTVTLLTLWVTSFLVAPLPTMIYTLGVYFLAEVVAYGLAKLKNLRDLDDSRAAGIVLDILKVAARAVYAGMQVTIAGLMVVAMVVNPALAVLDLAILGALVYLDKKGTAEFQPRWQHGTCIACSDDALVNITGLCRACKKMQVEEDTAPFAQDHGTHATVMG
jgi:hypothetical protein